MARTPELPSKISKKNTKHHPLPSPSFTFSLHCLPEARSSGWSYSHLGVFLVLEDSVGDGYNWKIQEK